MRFFFLLIFIAITIPQMMQAAVPLKNGAPIADHLKVKNFVKMSRAEFEAASGRKFGLAQKMFFKKLQNRLIKSTYSAEHTILPYYNPGTGKFKLNWLWLILGALIGPFAVIFSYTIQNKSKNKQISALIGFGLFILWFGWFFIF